MMQEFLASIGYEVDEAKAAEFDAAIRKTEALWTNVAKAGAAMAAALAALIVRTTTRLESAAFAADRLGTSVGNLRAIAYAMEQTGQNGARAGDLIGGLASTLRRMPETTEAIIRGLGVRTRENGQLRDTGEMYLDIVEALAAKPRPLGKAIGETLGISEPDLNNTALHLSEMRKRVEEQKDRDRKSGVDRDAAALGSIALGRGWRALQLELAILVDLVSSKLAPALMPIVESIDQWIKAHSTEIVRAISGLIDWLLAVAATIAKWFEELALVAAEFARFAKSIMGEKGFNAALFGFEAGFVALIASRVLRINKTLGLAIAALIGVFAARHALSAPTVQPAGQVETGPTGFWGSVAHRIAGFVGRPVDSIRHAIGLPTKNRPGETPAETGPALDRSTFENELKDPKVRQRLLAITEAEVGNQGENAQQAFMETIFNRAKARNKTLWETMHGSYFPAITHARTEALMGSRVLDQKYSDIYKRVIEGSNVSDYATGNASLSVEFGKNGYRTRSFGGEKFGVESPDVQWAARERARAQAEREREEIRRRAPAQLWRPADKLEWNAQRPFKSSMLIDGAPSVDATRTTKIVVKGDANPHQTAGAVGREQRRINSDWVSTASVA